MTTYLATFTFAGEEMSVPYCLACAALGDDARPRYEFDETCFDCGVTIAAAPSAFVRAWS